jgi:hypothetical protein
MNASMSMNRVMMNRTIYIHVNAHYSAPGMQLIALTNQSVNFGY